MFDMTKVPERIRKRLSGLEPSVDGAGKSNATVLLFDEMVLKIEETSRSSEHEATLLSWLQGKLPVPRVIEAETHDGCSYLLMSKAPGEMVCTGDSLKYMEDTVIALAGCLKTMWRLDITNCPCRNTVSEKLTQAKYYLEHNLVNFDDFEPETLGPDGFASVYALYDYLDSNRPQEEWVFSHGDFSFPNIFVSGRGVTGLIDWGNGGVADRWQDISICYRALRKKYSKYALYSEKEYLKYKAFFFKELGLEPDEEKARYFNLLDEFF